jgi:hypothetical protein
VEHRPGSSNHAADTISRLEPPSPTLLDEPIDTDIPVLALEEVMSQEKSPVLSVVDLMAAQQRDTHALAVRGLLKEHSSWDVDHNGTIGRILPSGEFEVYVPDVIRSTDAFCFVTDSEPFARDGSDLSVRGRANRATTPSESRARSA